MQESQGLAPRGLGPGALGPARFVGRWCQDPLVEPEGFGPYGWRVAAACGVVAPVDVAVWGLTVAVSASLDGPVADAALVAEFGPAEPTGELCSPLSAARAGVPRFVEGGDRFALACGLVSFDGDLYDFQPQRAGGLELPWPSNARTAGEALERASALTWLTSSGAQRTTALELRVFAGPEARCQWKTMTYPDLVLRRAQDEGSLAESLLHGRRVVIGAALSAHQGVSVDSERAVVELIHMGVMLALCREGHWRRFPTDKAGAPRLRPWHFLVLGLPRDWHKLTPGRARKDLGARAWCFSFGEESGISAWRSCGLTVHQALGIAFDYLHRE